MDYAKMDLQAEIAQQKRDLSSKDCQIQNLQLVIEKKKNATKTALDKADSLEKEAQRLREQLSNVNLISEKNSKELQRTTVQFKSLDSLVKELKKKNGELTDKNDELKNQIFSMKQDNNTDSRNSLANEQQLQTMKAAITHLEQTNRQLKTEREEFENDNTALRLELENLSKQVSDLKDHEKGQKSGEMSKLRTLLSQKDDEFKHALSTSQKEIEKLQENVRESESVTKDELERLQKELSERSSSFDNCKEHNAKLTSDLETALAKASKLQKELQTIGESSTAEVAKLKSDVKTAEGAKKAIAKDIYDKMTTITQLRRELKKVCVFKGIIK
eukprot:TRINITY_DN6533_c1_g1_i2.p1 TRINITY_DN6533_c1_g1~~TRINITY_DN6533_c1_g1_i2.p1  ORF type:complete len:331 (-),score=118.67 TRINITY_DN6533_c1_g1_i2:295-1287(-)